MPVEKAAHVHTERMRHISDSELLAAVELTLPGLEDAAAAADAGDVEGGAAELASFLASRRDRALMPDVRRWASTVSGTQREKEVLAAADDVVNRRVDFTDGTHGRSGLYALHYLDWARPLPLAFACTGQERYLSAWARHFDGWYASRDQVQGEWPGLDVIWYTLGVAARSNVITLAMRTFERHLPQRTLLDMLRTLVGGARWLHEEHDLYRAGNWQIFGCAELLHVACFLPELREARGWRDRARLRLTEHLELDVHPDGGHRERAPGYHALCLEAYTKAAVAGATVGWKIGDHPRFAAMYGWLAAMSTAAGWVPPFNDSPVVWVGEHALRGHHLLGDPSLGTLGERLLAPDVASEVEALLPKDARPSAASLRCDDAAAGTEESCLLPTSKFAVLRDGSHGHALYAALNYGPHVGHELESHSHDAALDVVLSGWGHLLAGEAGGPSTYDDAAYHDWYRATHAHSTVLVDGQVLSDDHDGTLLHFGTSPVVDTVVVSHAGFLPTTHTRTLAFVHPSSLGAGYWILADELDGAGPFTWVLHGRSAWVAGSARSHHSAEAPGLVAVPVRPELVRDITFGSGPGSIPDPDSSTTDHAAVHSLRIHQREGAFETVLVPYTGQPPSVTVTARTDHVEIAIGDQVDSYGRGWWIRDRGASGLAAAVWRRPELRHEKQLLLSAAALRHGAFECSAERVRAVVDVEGASDVQVLAPCARAVHLQGIALSLHEQGGMVRVPVPYAGCWQIDVELDPDHERRSKEMYR